MAGDRLCNGCGKWFRPDVSHYSVTVGYGWALLAYSKYPVDRPSGEMATFYACTYGCLLRVISSVVLNAEVRGWQTTTGLGVGG